MTASERETILRIEHITKRFPLEGGKVLTACNDVTFPVYRGEILGIVGESGCGKSTLVRTLMQLHQPSDGQIFFKDKEITSLRGEDARNMRRSIQMVFQDPTTSFNPKMKIKDIICEPLRNFGLLQGSARDKAAELLRLVDLPEEFAERYPTNMSGGQRQRVGIARALLFRMWKSSHSRYFSKIKSSDEMTCPPKVRFLKSNFWGSLHIIAALYLAEIPAMRRFPHPE